MQLDSEDLRDLMPLLLLAKLDTSGTMNEVRAVEDIGKVVDRHVARALKRGTV